MTQLSSNLIIKRIQTNDYMVERWASLVERQIIEYFNIHKTIPSCFHVLITTDRIGDYHSYIERDFPLDINGIRRLQQHNFKYGFPMCCSICAFMITANDNNGKPQDALMMMMETPLNTYKKVFIVHEQDDQKKLIYDDYMSKFVTFNTLIQQFGMINCQKLRILN